MSEGDFIKAYKDYARKHLPHTGTLGGLWAPDFDKTNYMKRCNNDLLGCVELYLKEMKPYAQVLIKAAYLRQIHFERWIQNKREEDPGHRHWRIGMNLIARDAAEKVKRWTTQQDRLLTKAINHFEKTHTSTRWVEISEFAHVRNVIDKSISVKTNKQVKRPMLSTAERNKRRRAKCKKREREDNKQIDAAIENVEIHSDNLLEYALREVSLNHDKLMKKTTNLEEYLACVQRSNSQKSKLESFYGDDLIIGPVLRDVVAELICPFNDGSFGLTFIQQRCLILEDFISELVLLGNEAYAFAMEIFYSEMTINLDDIEKIDESYWWLCLAIFCGSVSMKQALDCVPPDRPLMCVFIINNFMEFWYVHSSVVLQPVLTLLERTKDRESMFEIWNESDQVLERLLGPKLPTKYKGIPVLRIRESDARSLYYEIRAEIFRLAPRFKQRMDR